MGDLWIVTRIALTCMMGVLITGTWIDTAFPKQKQIKKVECSLSIQNSARKLNITLLGYDCEVDE